MIDDEGNIITNTMPTVTQATPSISVDSSGKITASATQSAGYVSAGTKSATKQLTTQAAKTITPSTSTQTAVASGRYTTGAVTVKGDPNLVAGNIKSGVSIFGVNGSYEGSGGSGGDIQTSNLTVTVNASSATDVYAGYFDGESMYNSRNSVSRYSTETFENIVTGSIVVIDPDLSNPVRQVSGLDIVGSVISQNGNPVFFYQITSSNASITFSVDNDIPDPM